jgi:hypothetical protein
MARSRHRRGAPRAAVSAILTCLLLGPVVGLTWWAVAPTPEVVVRDGGVFLTDPETSAFIAADGWFAALGALAGLLSALLVFRRHRGEGVAALLGLTAGALVGSVLAWRLGHLLGPEELLPRARSAAEGTTLRGPLDLRAVGVLLLWPIASVAGFLSLTGRPVVASEQA